MYFFFFYRNMTDHKNHHSENTENIISCMSDVLLKSSMYKYQALCGWLRMGGVHHMINN